jgi:hypothetical protein
VAEERGEPAVAKRTDALTSTELSLARDEAMAKWLAKLEAEKAALAGRGVAAPRPEAIENNAATTVDSAASREAAAKADWLAKRADEKAAVEKAIAERAAAERSV